MTFFTFYIIYSLFGFLFFINFIRANMFMFMKTEMSVKELGMFILALIAGGVVTNIIFLFMIFEIIGAIGKAINEYFKIF